MLAGATGSAFAQPQDDWTVGVGVGDVNPNCGNGKIAVLNVDFDDDFKAEIDPVILSLPYVSEFRVRLRPLLASPRPSDSVFSAVSGHRRHQFPPDEHAPYFRGAGADLHQFRVAEEARDGAVAEETRAAHRLNGLMRLFHRFF